MRYLASAPTDFEMDHSLSFSSTTIFAPLAPAWLSASKATPAPRLASPITLTTWGGSASCEAAVASPRPRLMLVPACPVWKRS